MNAEIRVQISKLRHYYKLLLGHHRQGVEHCEAVIKMLDKDLAQQECTLTPEGKVIPVPSREKLSGWESGRFVFNRAGHLVDRSVE